MPNILDLSGVRGDRFLQAVPMYDGMGLPINTAQAQAVISAWPVIEMQVKKKATDPQSLISLKSADGELRIDPAYPFATGAAPAFIIDIAADKCGVVLAGVHDVQFSGPGSGPYTWLAGTFTLTQDVTRTVVTSAPV